MVAIITTIALLRRQFTMVQALVQLRIILVSVQVLAWATDPDRNDLYSQDNFIAQ